MGHGFGLPHSSGPYDETYDSRWDVMSDVWGNCPPWDPTYGCVGTHTISYHKDLLGGSRATGATWRRPARRATIAFEPLDQLATSGYMIARIPLPGSTTRFYTVETRRLAGYDAPLPGHAVIIHLVDTTRADRDAQVVDPDADRDPDDAGAMWLPGEMFVDSDNGISVAVVGETTQGFLVTVSASSGGPASYTLSVTVSGPGTVTSTPAGITCSAGTCSASFPTGSDVTLTASGGTLTGWGGACAGTAVCSVTMTGAKAATATFSTGSPDITLSPSAVAFGSVAVGAKGNQTVTVKNDGTTPLVLGTIALAGTDADQFLIVAASNLCAGRTLAAGQSCTVLVRFKPKTPGVKSAKLKVPSNDPDEAPAKLSLSGTASGAVAVPEITVTPTSLPFGTVAVGTKRIQTVTVKNDGTAALMLGVIGLSSATGEIALAARAEPLLGRLARARPVVHGRGEGQGGLGGGQGRLALHPLERRRRDRRQREHRRDRPVVWSAPRRLHPQRRARYRGAPAAPMARHTRSARSGMSRWRTPNGRSASTTALTTAGVEPMVAASPMPLAPSGIARRHAVTVWSVVNDGRSSARGSA